METITLPLADVRALVQLGWELTRHISETDTSATGSIYGIEYAHRTIAKVAVHLPEMPQQQRPESQEPSSNEGRGKQTEMQADPVGAGNVAAPSSNPRTPPTDDEVDELYADALSAVLQSRRASTSIIQRRLRIGYNRAARLMDLMEKRGAVGPENGASPREILIPA